LQASGGRVLDGEGEGLAENFRLDLDIDEVTYFLRGNDLMGKMIPFLEISKMRETILATSIYT